VPDLQRYSLAPQYEPPVVPSNETRWCTPAPRAGGWLMVQVSQGARKYTCVPLPATGRISQRAEEESPIGRRTGTSYSIERTTAGLWWKPTLHDEGRLVCRRFAAAMVAKPAGGYRRHLELGSLPRWPAHSGAHACHRSRGPAKRRITSRSCSIRRDDRRSHGPRQPGLPTTDSLASRTLTCWQVALQPPV
jgi:hypothetical protein